MSGSSPPRWSAPTGFVLRAAAWVAVLFGLLRLPAIESSLLIPFARLQGRLAAALAGREQLGVVVDSSCTGSDALALALGAILAFPAPWRRRLVGAALGFALVTAVNTVRIGHLAVVTGDRELFDLLHLQVWPAALVIVAAGYVFLWMRSTTASLDRQPPSRGECSDPVAADPTRNDRSSAAAEVASSVPIPTRAPAPSSGGRLWRFLIPAMVLVGAYYALSGILYESPIVHAAARGAAAVAGAVMGALGIEATVSGGLMRTANGLWLGLARLLVLALPPVVIGSHFVAVHAFYQGLLALVAIGWVARRTAVASPLAAVARRAAGAAAMGLGVGLSASMAATLLTRLAPDRWVDLHLGHGWVDPQGALTLAPAFGLGLLVALGRAAGALELDRRLAIAGTAIVLAWMAAAWLLGETATHADWTPPVAALRALALLLPLAAAWSLGWLPRMAAGRAYAAGPVLEPGVRSASP